MPPRNRERAIDILMVEDNPDDVELTMEALEEVPFEAKTYVATDGVEALAFLRQEGKYHGAPLPDLVLLDLNMPRKDGREVLSEIKADQRLKHIPVVILTTSAAQEDVLNAYREHVNCYITKPIDFDQYVEVVQNIQTFWLKLAELPPKD